MPTSRRAFLAAGAALAGCGGSDPGPGSRGPLPPLDARLLNLALGYEQTLVVAYEIGGELASGPARRAIAAIRDQEREHVERLTGLVRDLGLEPRRPKERAEYVRSFPRLRDQDDALVFASDLEERTVRTYLESLAKLSDRELRRLATSIATSEAQHLAVLNDLRGEPPAPRAYVTGTA